MDRSGSRRFLCIFFNAFIVLFVILVLLPFLVDSIIHLFNEGVTPGGNSVIVFKDLVGEQAIISRFIDALRKIIIFM